MEKHKVPVTPQSVPRICKPPMREMYGGYDGERREGSIASGLSMSRKIGTNFNTGGSALREIPPTTEPTRILFGEIE